MEHESYEDSLSRLSYKRDWEQDQRFYGECQACGSENTRLTFDKVLICRDCLHYEE